MLTELESDAFVASIHSFDLLIDARSPEEFSESHIPKAHNYFALSNAEHEEVGTLYKQVSRNDAKVLGASYICTNASFHVRNIYAKHRIGARIGIYCARGGLRSSSLALILSSIGYQVFKLRSGYKSYRNYVLQYLETFPHERFIVLGGNTGCGKTELLQHLTPSIDLEGLAHHMGSSFGHVKGAQPSQKAFENALVDKLSAIDASEAIFIEGESKRMGSITIPSILHTKMQQGFRVEITAPIEQRVEQILKDYDNVDASFFHHAMERITPYIKKSAKEEALLAFQSHDLHRVATILLLEYYDKVYKKPLRIDATVDNTHTKEALVQLVKMSTTSFQKPV
jgi:tRNA 2-selenouridine synthase